MSLLILLGIGTSSLRAVPYFRTGCIGDVVRIISIQRIGHPWVASVGGRKSNSVWQCCRGCLTTSSGTDLDNAAANIALSGADGIGEVGPQHLRPQNIFASRDRGGKGEVKFALVVPYDVDRPPSDPSAITRVWFAFIVLRGIRPVRNLVLRDLWVVSVAVDLRPYFSLPPSGVRGDVYRGEAMMVRVVALVPRDVRIVQKLRGQGRAGVHLESGDGIAGDTHGSAFHYWVGVRGCYGSRLKEAVIAVAFVVGGHVGPFWEALASGSNVREVPMGVGMIDEEEERRKQR